MKPSPEFLRSVALFNPLPEAALGELAASSQPRAIEEGGFFFMHGESTLPANSVRKANRQRMFRSCSTKDRNISS
jgi:hypothetical protein